MTNEAAKQETEVVYKANNEDVKLTRSMVKNFLVSGNGKISDQETMMFLSLCKFQHLNPFLNEAYLIKFGSSPAQIITSKEAFMKRAESHPDYNGVKAGLIVLRNNDLKYTKGAFKLPTDKILGAWAEVSRKDRTEPHHIEISMEEFSKSQSTWKSMPATMIRKTAIVNALREAFPETLGGMYTEDDKNPEQAAPQTAQDEKGEQLADKLAGKQKPKKEEQKSEPVEGEFEEVEGEQENDSDAKQTELPDEETDKSEQQELLHQGS